jgi:hypothetical protein
MARGSDDFPPDFVSTRQKFIIPAIITINLEANGDR